MPHKGYKPTEESKRKNSEAHKGNIPWNKGKTGIYSEETLKIMREVAKLRIPPMLGKHHTEDTKRKISINKIGKKQGINNPFYGKTHTRASLKKMSEANKGKKISENTRIKMSEANKKLWENPEYKQKMSENRKGIKFSDEHRKNMGESKKGEKNYQYGKLGEKSVNWMGGISFAPYSTDFNRQLKELIRLRDEYKCQLCGISEGDNNDTLNIHHIDYDKMNSLPDNLISLCKKCHMKTNYKRNYWKVYFSDLQQHKIGEHKYA